MCYALTTNDNGYIHILLKDRLLVLVFNGIPFVENSHFHVTFIFFFLLAGISLVFRVNHEVILFTLCKARV